MKTEIFIENKRLDITEDISSLLNYTIDDIKDFASRNTNFSKTIVLPGTANNNFLFGHNFDVTVLNPFDPATDNAGFNYNAAKSAKCIIFKDHIQVFKGVIRLMNIVIMNGIPEYECAVFGELGGLISSLGNLKLSDLDFSAYDQTWTAAHITATWPNYNQGSGLFYPLIDYGEVSAAKVDYDIRALRPALFVREYLDKILTNAGYAYSSNLFETSRFKSLIIPHNRKNLTKLDTELAHLYRIIDLTILDDAGGVNEIFPWEGSTLTGLFTLTSGNTVLTYIGSDPVPVNVVFGFQGMRHSLRTDFTLSVLLNGVEIPSMTLNLVSNHSTTDIFWEWIVDKQITLNTGDTLEWSFLADDSPHDSDFTMTVEDAAAQIISVNPVQITVPVGGLIDINSTIPPNILQKDFFSSIIKLFNLYVYEDKLRTKFLYIEPYVDFFNVSGVTNWTYKIDRTKAIELTPMSELNSRYYNFGFKPDSDYYNELYKKRYNETYGDYIYDSEFEFVNESQDATLIFSPSPLVGYGGVDKIVPAIYKQTNGVEEGIDFNIRLLQALNVTGVTSWAIKDGVGTLQSGLTTYGYGGHYNDPDAPANDIHFGVPRELFFTLVSGSINVTQFNVYWSPYMAEITDKDSKLLKAFFKLDPKDIYDLDFSKFVFLLNSYWRLNKIVDWNASNPDVCKCELLKVINTVY